MPELPDITVYIDALTERVVGRPLELLTISSPFLLRTASPPIHSITGKSVNELRRLGKRIVFGFHDDLWLVLHLMIAGRLHWQEPQSPDQATASAKPKKRTASKAGPALARFTFPNGTLTLTEAGTRKRASLHLLEGEGALNSFNRGGLEVLGSDLQAFAQRLTLENHTLKRALTDPHLFSGIGNAYSDEILHRAQLSPITLTTKLSLDEIKRLHAAVIEMMNLWIERLRTQYKGTFPENVTAFRPDMAVHGKFGQPCPVCGTKIQRIRYAENETNYCPKCQTGGRLLADRALSLLLKRDWPKTPEEFEEMRRPK